MLKYRLIYGTLMILLFGSLLVMDGWLDGSLTATASDDKEVWGTIFAVLIVFLVVAANIELSQLAQSKGIAMGTALTMATSAALALTWYFGQVWYLVPEIYLFAVLAGGLLGLLLYQRIFHGLSNVMANCGMGCFAVVYCGVLSAFAVAIRVDFGVWPLLMYVFVVKSSDIGAYTFGRLFGRHKFAPVISPGKTWEGMCGAAAVAGLVSVAFAVWCAIIGVSWFTALLFGVFSAFIGQLGDLAESMLKRDAEQKDSGRKVPGFGGILDVVDSPLVAAPFAYMFFRYIA